MRTLNFLLVILVLALGWAGSSAPAHAQFFEPRYSPPGGGQRVYRLPGGGGDDEGVRRRQYIPEQRPRPRERSFFDRLFGRPVVRPPPSLQRPDGVGAPPSTADNDQQAPAAPKVPKTIFVAVMGDSLAENLSPGLSDALSERPEVGLVREIRPGVGLLKENKTSWRQTADEILARQPPVAAAVIFIGPTDDAPAPKKKAQAEQSGPQIATTSPWMDDYATKVDELALAFRQRNIPLLWVGLPPVEDPQMTAEYLQLNDLVRQRVAALGGTFIDVWEGFVNEDEEFTVQGPNIEGRVVRLRTADGLHFTKAGARKIGHAVELELRTILAPKDQGDAISDLGGVDPGAPTVPGSSRILALGSSPRTPGAILVPPAAPEKDKSEKKPEFNPGIIAGPEGAAPDPSAAKSAAPPVVTEDALVSGTAVPAKPGRADDFAWPANSAN